MQTILYDNMPTEYRNESTQNPPKFAQSALKNTNAKQIVQAARNNIATVWTGDFYQAKQILDAMKKRFFVAAKSSNNPTEAFHKHRLAQSQNSRLANAILLRVNGDYSLDLPRAPDVQAALTDVYGAANGAEFLLPLNQLLGFIGAHEWHKKGVFVPELDGKIHVPFGVFSPLRGEYLSLVNSAKLPENAQIAWDIGTGSGVLAMILAKRGIPKIIATDNNSRAILSAQKNSQLFDLNNQIDFLQQDLFPEGRADLMVCNPPWLPAKPTSAIETALYDPNHAMLHAVLRGAAARLNDGGELWLILSDLAEHLGLREKNILEQWFNEYGWNISGCLKTAPQHSKSHNPNDVLAFARMREKTYLYILTRKIK